MEEQEAVVEEKKPSLFSLIEEGGAEQLDKQLEEDEEREEKLSSFSPDGHTPLELAAMLGKEEVAKVLVAKGAEVNATNTSGQFHVHMQVTIDYVNLHAHMFAYMSALFTLSGYTALHMCVAWGYLDCTKSLISLGADPQLRTRHGETVIELALRYKRTECANFLDTVGECIGRPCLMLDNRTSSVHCIRI